MEITKKIHLLKIDFSVQITPEISLPRFVNVLILFGNSITVIDSGVKNSYPFIYDYIQKQGRKISEIKTLILSHAHPDHIGSASKIKKDTGCKIIGHLNEKSWIENIDEQYKMRPVPGFYGLVDESVKLDTVLTGGESLTFDDDIHAKIINTPGHSKGSFSILFKDDSVLFTADSLPVENDIPTYDNFKELKKTIQNIKSIPDYKTLLSSWMSPLEDKANIVSFIEKGDQYLDRLDSCVKKHYSDKEEKPLDNCAKVIHELGLPVTFVTPLVDRAFKTHV
ncbi:MAG: MBL fold metallo-hydrolase [Fibrobacteraceae bacterium]|nr:MBL fold metallo-hydrolase [Fibrobacteraceae bacterium]